MLVSDLITDAQNRLDIPNSNNPTSAQWLNYAQYGVKSLYGIIVNTHETYVTAQVQYTLPSSNAQTNQILLGYGGNIAPDFDKFLRLEVLRSQSGGIFWDTVLEVPNQLERNKYNYAPVVPTLSGRARVKALLQGNVLEVLPVLSCAGTYQVTYIPNCPTLTLSSPIDGYAFMTTNGWQELVVVSMCKSAAAQLEDYDKAAFYASECQRLEAKVRQEAQPRDDSQPAQIGDVRGIGGGWNGGYGNGGYG